MFSRKPLVRRGKGKEIPPILSFSVDACAVAAPRTTITLFDSHFSGDQSRVRLFVLSSL